MSAIPPVGPSLALSAAREESDRPSPYDLLLGHIDEVIAEWRALALSEPWAAIPGDRLVDSFPEILPRLFRLARSGATQVDPPLAEHIADAHGGFRRLDAVPLAAVAEEWSLVKRSCWKVLRQRLDDDRAVSMALQRLDVLIDDAIGYTLRGYYAPELDTLRGRGLERRDRAGDRRAGGGDRRAAE